MKWTRLPPSELEENYCYFIEGDNSYLTIDKRPKSRTYVIIDGSTDGVVSKHKTLREAKVAYLFLRNLYLGSGT